jgi:demethylmenaquinone methyltransferase/2-methoxy-6-polyprenyl-1,4-benzoquinol methylase
MDSELRRQMFRYYDERAPDYEEAYTLGTGTASMSDANVFTTEASALPEIVGRFAHGRLLDLACGTGYWLPHYAYRCSHITLFDQSANMLAESRAKVDRLGIVERCDILHGDFVDHALEHGAYDCALVGFLLSHLTEAQEPRLFEVLGSALRASGRFLVLDSAWTDERARFNAKVEQQERRLNDGTSFRIYKRYLDRADVSRWAAQYGAALSIEYFGRAFLAVSGSFTSAGGSS